MIESAVETATNCLREGGKKDRYQNALGALIGGDAQRGNRVSGMATSRTQRDNGLCFEFRSNSLNRRS